MKNEIEIEIQNFWLWAEITPEKYAIYGMTNNKEESEYSRWQNLIDIAFNILESMQNKKIDDNEIDTFLLILALDNECEEILDILKKHFLKIQTDNKNMLLLHAVGYCQYEARWQIADLLGIAEEPDSIIYLKCLINDIHPYVQRRALLSLININLNEAKKYFSYLEKNGDDITKMIIKEISSVNT